MNTAFVNGKWTLLQDATVSVLDRGFLFGDGAYEVIPYFQATPVGLQQHLERLQHSLNQLDIPNPYSHAQWKSLFEELISTNGIANTDNFMIYLQVTRGADQKRHHLYPLGLTPTVVLFCAPIATSLQQHQTHGAKAITLPDLRHDLSHVKSLNLLANVLALHQAQQQGAIEAILHRDNTVIECTCSNVFIVQSGVLITPPLQPTMLSGITRCIVLDIAQEINIPAEQRPFSVTELTRADEVWITSSTKTLIPITRIDDSPIANGAAGPVGLAIQHQFQQTYCNLTPGEKNGT